MATKKAIKSEPFIPVDQIEWESAGEGIQRKILGYDDELMSVLVRFEKGAVGALHHHSHRQVSYVESGRCEVASNGDKKVLKQGDSFFVAPDLEHGAVALEEGVLHDIFAPARRDFCRRGNMQ